MSHLAQYAVTVARGTSLAPPPPESRFRRFLWGFALPFGIVRRVFHDHHARRCWLGWSSVQLAVLVAVGLRIGLSTSHAADNLARHPSVRDVVELASVTYAALCIVEWIVIALARDYHDVLSAIAARVTGVPSEPLVRPPKIRLDFGWLWTKGKRRLRAALLFVSGLPLIALVLLIPLIGDALYVVLSSIWAMYWVAVFAIGGSALAWETPPDAPPWHVRGLRYVGRVPVLGLPPRFYAWILAGSSRSVHSVCRAFEADPYAAAGLAAARTLAGVPGLYLFFRPAFSVAATHALVERRRRLAAPSPPPLDRLPPA